MANETWPRLALERFRAAGVRPPACAGGVYPADAAALRRALDGYLARAGGGVPAMAGPATAGTSFSLSPAAGEGRGEGEESTRPLRFLVAPHIDYARGGASYARAYRAIRASDADLFVVFGTAHVTPPRLFTLTRLDYRTPLGVAATDRQVVAALASALGEEALFADELAHRDEHSCELQLPWLQHLLAPRPFTVVPVLCSSITPLRDPSAATAGFHAALARATAGRRACFIAAADLAHVGPAYGDARPPTPGELRTLETEDRRALARVAAGDADGFHREAVRDDARRRLCGVAPIHAALRASGVRGARLVDYAQWTDGVDSVSYAAMAG